MKSRPHLPVLVLSALSDVESKVRCFELGAADYMTKPFALAELRARIRARLGSPGGRRRSVLTAQRIELDPAPKDRRSREKAPWGCRTGSSCCSSTSCAHQGEVCSRAELLEEVWGCSFDPGTNVVDVYVGRLRAKLGSSVIATVRNVGYYVPVA